jgi:hypothetical protein
MGFNFKANQFCLDKAFNINLVENRASFCADTYRHWLKIVETPLWRLLNE